MARFLLGLTGFCLVLSVHCMPEGFKASSSKLIKIKEAASSKDVLIMKKTLLNSPKGNGIGDTSKTYTKVITSETNDEQPAPAPAPAPAPTRAPHDFSHDVGPIEWKTEAPSTRAPHDFSHDVGPIEWATDAPPTPKVRTPISVNGGCIRPRPQPYQLHHKFLKLLLTHRVFLPFGSKHYFDKLSQAITGKDFDENDGSSACFRGIWEPKKQRLHGYNQRALMSCHDQNSIATDIKCRRQDKPFEDYGGEFRYTALWSDGKNNVLISACTDDGTRGAWAVVTNKRTISPETKADVLDMVARWGFDPEDHFELSYENCAQAIKDDFQEGPCDEEIPLLPSEEVEMANEILKRGVYTPLSSHINVYASAWFLRSQPFKETEDLDTVCSFDQWNSNGVVYRGFGNRKSTLECVKENEEITCSPDDSKTDSENVYVYNAKITPIWTDGEKYVLTYNCLSMNLKTWALYSTDKYIDDQTKRFVLAKVADYGFDPVKSRDTNYDGCKEV